MYYINLSEDVKNRINKNYKNNCTATQLRVLNKFGIKGLAYFLYGDDDPKYDNNLFKTCDIIFILMDGVEGKGKEIEEVLKEEIIEELEAITEDDNNKFNYLYDNTHYKNRDKDIKCIVNIPYSVFDEQNGILNLINKGECISLI